MNSISSMRHQSFASFKIFLSLVLFATLSRIAIPPIIGHLPNFSAIDALALFCGAYYQKRIVGFMLVLFSVWIGDIVLNHFLLGSWVLFYSGCYWQYFCYLLITLIGSLLKNNRSILRLLAAALTSSILFFVISNFGVWCSGFLYPLTSKGLISCYMAALPFFKNTLLSDLFFTIILFSIFDLCKITLLNTINSSNQKFSNYT